MGVTIFYRGTLGDLDRIVDFEDRVVDLALELHNVIEQLQTDIFAELARFRQRSQDEF
jgi:hypothetical protein